jgi:hypothetical protein
MPLSSKPLLRACSVSKSRRTLALAMLGFVAEALCVLGRAAGPVEIRAPFAGAAFVLVERTKGRTGLVSQAPRHRSS